MGRWQREALTEGLSRNVAIAYGDGPPPHGFATGRIHSIAIPAKGVQRHVTLKHDLAGAVNREGETSAFAGVTTKN